MKGAQPLRRLLLARRDLDTQLGQVLAHGRIGERLDHGAVELRHDIGGRALGCPQAMPERQVKPRYPCFIDGGNIGRRGPAALRQQGERLDLAADHVRARGRGFEAREIDLSGDEVLHRWAGAAIGHELKMRPGVALEINSAQMRRTAGADNAQGRLVGVAF